MLNGFDTLNKKEIVNGQGCIWWISNLGVNQTSIEFDVENLEQAISGLELLSKYDLALGDLIQSNVGGYHHYHQENDEWLEFEDENGDDIWELINNA